MKNTLLSNSFILPLLLFLFSFGLTNFDIIDRIGQHWLFLSLFNVFLFAYIYSNKGFVSFQKILSNRIIFSFLIFLLFCLLSLFFSYNLTESFVVISRWLTGFIFIFLLVSYLNLFSFNKISYVLTIFLLFTLYFTFKGYLNIVSKVPYDFQFAPYLMGITGNKNITAVLFTMLLPFVYYLLSISKSIYLKSVFFIILSLSFFNVFILGSRTSFLVLIFQSLLVLVISLFEKYKFRLNNLFLINRLFLWFLPLCISYFIFNSSLSNSSDSTVINRISSISTANESANIRFRFYKESLDYVLSNPFTPIGLGNWKIKSVNWDKENINGFTVPYHAHNDFLELATEITIFGIFFYFLIFFFSFTSSLRISFNSNDIKKRSFFLSIILSGSAFFIDSFFNFPSARTIQFVIFSIVISFTILFSLKNLKHE